MNLTRQQVLLTELEIKSLVIQERYYRDARQWDDLRDSYVADAAQTLIRVSWFTGNVDAFVERSRSKASKGIISSHTIQPVKVHLNDSKSRALAISVGTVTNRLALEGVEYDVMCRVRFVTRLQITEEDEWKLVGFEAIYDYDTITPTQPMHKVPVIDTTGLRASYKYLAWSLTLGGYTIDQHQPGTDDEVTMNKCLDAGRDWLKSGIFSE